MHPYVTLFFIRHAEQHGRVLGHLGHGLGVELVQSGQRLSVAAQVTF